VAGEMFGIGIFLRISFHDNPVHPALTVCICPRTAGVALVAHTHLPYVYDTFCTWLLMGFFKTIPLDIEEQAMIDGLSRLGAMVKVVLPLAISGILTIVVFASPFRCTSSSTPSPSYPFCKRRLNRRPTELVLVMSFNGDRSWQVRCLQAYRLLSSTHSF